MTLLLQIYGPRQIHGTWDEKNQPSSCWVTMFARIGGADGYVRMSPVGKWPCCCTSMGQDKYMEFEMAQIGPVVVKLHHLQGLDIRLDWQKEARRLFYSPPHFPSPLFVSNVIHIEQLFATVGLRHSGASAQTPFKKCSGISGLLKPDPSFRC